MDFATLDVLIEKARQNLTVAHLKATSTERGTQEADQALADVSKWVGVGNWLIDMRIQATDDALTALKQQKAAQAAPTAYSKDYDPRPCH